MYREKEREEEERREGEGKGEVSGGWSRLLCHCRARWKLEEGGEREEEGGRGACCIATEAGGKPKEGLCPPLD